MNSKLEKKEIKQVLIQKELYKVDRWEKKEVKISVITATPVSLIEGKLPHMLLENVSTS